jgi:hypothetical protein
MSRSDKLARKSIPNEIDDPIVAGALKHFKASVDAWSEAAYSRPRFNESRLSESRSAVRTAQHNWRLAASWALGCLLIAGSLAGGLYAHRQRQEAARAAAMKAAEQKAELIRAAAEQRVTPTPVAAISIATKRPTAVKRAVNTDEDLLATVDSDVSRQVPAAMEPLAQMMDGNGTN